MSEPKRRGRPPTVRPPGTPEKGWDEWPATVVLRPSHIWEYEQVVYTEPPLRAELTRYGALGWELITVYTNAPPMHDATFYAVFKREVAG